jgi:hypothetical protein
VKTLKNSFRRIFRLVSFLILLCLLTVGGIALWQGIFTQDQGLIGVSLVIILCTFLGGLAWLQAFVPGLKILSPNFPTIMFWIILGFPVSGLVLLMGAAALYGLWRGIFQGKLFSLTWRELQGYFWGIVVGLGFPLSMFAAWIKSRKLGRPMHEVWEEWLEGFRRR